MALSCSGITRAPETSRIPFCSQTALQRSWYCAAYSQNEAALCPQLPCTSALIAYHSTIARHDCWPPMPLIECLKPCCALLMKLHMSQVYFPLLSTSPSGNCPLPLQKSACSTQREAHGLYEKPLLVADLGSKLFLVSESSSLRFRMYSFNSRNLRHNYMIPENQCAHNAQVVMG